LFKSILKYLIYGNIWVSFSVLFFTYSTFLFLGTIDTSFLSFSFFSTLLAYNFHRIYKISELDRSFSRNLWLIENKLILYLLTLIGFFGTVISFLFLPNQIWILLIIPSLFSVFYVVPVNKNKQSFRDLPFLKIYLIAFSWVFVSVVIPLVMNSVSWNLSLGVLFEKLFFVIALTIPFDIRDMSIDNPIKRTIPQILGVKKSIYLAISFLILSSGVVLWLFQEHFYTFESMIALLLSYIISIIVVLQTNLKRKEIFYTGIIDGLFIVQFVLVYLVFYLDFT